jgi:hypothetical protein
LPSTLHLFFTVLHATCTHIDQFLDSSRYIPDTGPLDLMWIPNDAFGGLAPSTTTTTTTPNNDIEVGLDASDEDGSSDTIGEREDAIKVEDDDELQADADMDVADDVDQWL